VALAALKEHILEQRPVNRPSIILAAWLQLLVLLGGTLQLQPLLRKLHHMLPAGSGIAQTCDTEQDQKR
jgi:hypothetical protein